MIKGKCCSIWTVVTIILVLAALVAAAYVIMQKLNMLGCRYQPMDEGYWPDEPEEKEEADSDVPRATQQDFV